MADLIIFDSWSNPSTLNNNGKYASVSDMPYTGQKFTYHRGYGNLVVHQTLPEGKLNTSLSSYNRIQPLANFGSHLPTNSCNEFKCADSETFTGSWDIKPKYL